MMKDKVITLRQLDQQCSSLKEQGGHLMPKTGLGENH